MTKVICALCLVALTGCAAFKTQEVTVKEAVSCVGELPEKPVLLYGKGEYPGDIEGAKLMYQDLERLEAYCNALDAAVKACKLATPPKKPK